MQGFCLKGRTVVIIIITVMAQSAHLKLHVFPHLIIKSVGYNEYVVPYPGGGHMYMYVYMYSLWILTSIELL